MSFSEYSGKYTSTKLRSGTVYSYRIFVPDDHDGKTPLAVLVTHDGLNEAEARAMEKLSKTNEAPDCVIIGLTFGHMYASNQDGFERGMRFIDYDMYDSEYVDFLIDEFIPYVKGKYGLILSDDPNLHMISGGSSGGISAWNGVWFRNDYFRRAYLSSPTFSALARGNMSPVHMRLFETKPIRVFVDCSENEPDDYFGNSYCAALEARYALEFAGYDHKWNYYPGEGHCSRIDDEAAAEEVMRFLWKDWQTEPVKPLRLSKRADAVIYADKPWEEAEAFIPGDSKAILKSGEYKVADSKILFSSDGKERVVSAEFPSPSSVAVSSDLWRLYIADASRGCIYVSTICENGDLVNTKKMTSLQMPTDFHYPGAFDICTDANDRIFAATELGIQCIRTCGMIDVILPLPGNQIPQRVWLKEDRLYADCGGRIFSRKIKSSAKKDPLVAETPKCIGYYD